MAASLYAEGAEAGKIRLCPCKGAAWPLKNKSCIFVAVTACHGQNWQDVRIGRRCVRQHRSIPICGPARATKGRLAHGSGYTAQAVQSARTGQKRESMNNAPKQTKGIFPRKCHDCGKPTSDYRCQECWKKWRRKHGVSVDGKED